MYSEKWKRNLLAMSGLIDFVIIRKKLSYQSNNTGNNENNKEILKKFNLD